MDPANATYWKIIDGLFAIVLLPLLYWFLRYTLPKLWSWIVNRIVENKGGNGESPQPSTKIKLAGEWRGAWQGEALVYEFAGDLSLSQGIVAGTITWTLTNAPPGSRLLGELHLPKVEHVIGSLIRDNIHIVTRRMPGKQTQDRFSYSLTLSSGKTEFEGTSIELRDHLSGQIKSKASFSPSAYEEIASNTTSSTNLVTS